MGQAEKQELLWWQGVLISVIKRCRVMRQPYDEQVRLHILAAKSVTPKGTPNKVPPATPSPNKNRPGGRISFDDLESKTISSDDDELARKTEK